MGLNIKTSEAQQLARELAELTGDSMAKAVTEAIRLRVEDIKREQGKAARLEEVTRLARDIRQRLNRPGREMMRIEDLYDDETGLPK